MDNFQSFSQYSGINRPGVFSEDPSRCMAFYSLNDFRNAVKYDLYESGGYADDQDINEAYSYYEMASLFEARSEWVNESEGVMSIDAGDHVILVKGDTPYIISKTTFDAINEGSIWDSAKRNWMKLSAKVSSGIDSMSAGAKKAWNAMSDGAKKAWEFVKTIPSVVTKMVKEMSWKEWAGLVLGFIGALAGLVGSAIPGVTIIGGCALALAGAIDIWEGFEKYKLVSEELKTVGDVKLKDVKDGKILSKTTAFYASALPNIANGSILMSLGIKDVLEGSTTAMVNPAAGSISLAIKGAALKASKTTVASFGHAGQKTVHKYIQEVVSKIIKNPKIAAKLPDSLGKTSLLALGNLVLGKCLEWLFKGLISGMNKALSAIDFLMSIPGKMSQGIATFRKKATSPIGKIVAGGLNTLVKPLTDSCSKMIKKHIQPIIASTKSWLTRQSVSYDLCKEALKKVESESGKEIKTNKVPVTKTKPIINPKIKPQQASKKDLELAKKMNGKGKNKKLAESDQSYTVYTIDQFLRFG